VNLRWLVSYATIPFILLFFDRGKVSEGIDFTDNKGRVVIITGTSHLCRLYV